MTNKEKKNLIEKIESEGFEYALLEYTEDIEDENFLDLLRKYEKIREEIKQYIGYDGY